MAEAYELALVPTAFGPFAKDLAARAAQLGSKHPLELAAGTGVVTAEVLAQLPSTEVIASDLSEAMVVLGERRAPGALWRTADATACPRRRSVRSGAVSVRLTFFPDKPAALSEARRVLVEGGSCLLNAWATLEGTRLPGCRRRGV